MNALRFSMRDRELELMQEIDRKNDYIDSLEQRQQYLQGYIQYLRNLLNFYSLFYWFDAAPKDEVFTCMACGLPTEKKDMHRHHVSYHPPQIILVCKSCHFRITTCDEYPWLHPGEPRPENF